MLLHHLKQVHTHWHTLMYIHPKSSYIHIHRYTCLYADAVEGTELGSKKQGQDLEFLCIRIPATAKVMEQKALLSRYVSNLYVCQKPLI